MRPASLSGMPTSCAMVRASSSARALSPSEIFCRYSARSAAGRAAQASNAPRAARAAASASRSPAAGMRPITAPLPALCTSIVSRVDGATHWPPIQSFSLNMGISGRDDYCIQLYFRAMPRKAKAALCREHNKPVVVEEINLDAPKGGEVTVRLGACRVCHSDLSAITGTIALPLPLVLGHEGAGVVEEVGEGVTEFATGDHVIFSFIYMCGKCRFCVSGRPVLCLEQGKALTTPLEGTPRVHDSKGAPLNIFSGCGAMAEYATVSGENLIKVDPKIPAECAALVGCGVTTGVGAVFNTAKVEPGASVAVFGCGGVGLSVIQGARIAGAERIIAIDTLEPKLAMAKQFGASDVLLAAE